jgi:hypothetical protein
VYYYGTKNQTMTLEADFSGVADNGGFGIPLNAASTDKPWTMDGSANMQWQYRIAAFDGTGYESGWYSFNENSRTLDMSNVNAAGEIQLKYQDSLGNDSGWIETGMRVSYDSTSVSPVSSWSADYDPDANTITIAWTNPSQREFAYTELSIAVNGGAAQVFDKRKEAEHIIPNVPRLTTAGVTGGTAVGNVYGYEITLQARSVSAASAPVSFRIWNIGTPTIAVDPDRGITAPIPAEGMSVSKTNPAVEIADAADFADIPTGDSSSDKTYVLANDITLSGAWSPIGKDDDDNPANGSTQGFEGKFYGNGHTITVSGNPVDTAYIGVFGYVDSAEIRDLKVQYEATTVNSATASHTGGIAGYAGGATEIRNVITGGSLGLTSSSANAVYAGGIAGEAGGGANIRNCLSAVDVTLDKGSASGAMYAGGVAGKSAGTGIMEDVVYSGVLAVGRNNASAAVDVYTGGIAGNASTSIHNASFAGTIRIPDTFASGTGSNYFGGLVGRYDGGSVTMENAFSRGDLTVYRNSLCDLLVGGLAGCIEGNSASSKISLENCAVESGAIRVESGKNRDLWAGGCIGRIQPYVVFTNVRSLGGAVTVEQTDTGIGRSSHIGGFAGYLEGSTVNGSFSNTTVTGNFNSHSYTGGFIGFLEVVLAGAEIKNCYATGNVTVSN